MAVAPSTVALNGTYSGRALSVNGRPVTAARLNPLARYATILPDRHNTSKSFEYIFNEYNTYASIFDYPKSDQQIGSIAGDGGQGCTNVLYGYGKKIIWNVGGPDQITEYKVPKTPIKTLSVPNSFPTSCAMNTSGDLAVGIYDGTASVSGGDVVIFKNASGPGTVYTTPLDEEFFDGYDNQGNLFADGFTGYRSGFALVELPKGSSKFETIKTSNTVQFPGSVQWDGTHLTVFDQDANQTYQYTVSGTTATLKGTVSLSGSSDCAQTWIVQSLVYCADAGNNDGEVYSYPAGGSAIALLAGNFDLPLGVTAAKK
ncbi:MAG: hypothetical protein WA215_04735 [Candidatus Cybelea sp.]